MGNGVFGGGRGQQALGVELENRPGVGRQVGIRGGQVDPEQSLEVPVHRQRAEAPQHEHNGPAAGIGRRFDQSGVHTLCHVNLSVRGEFVDQARHFRGVVVQYGGQVPQHRTHLRLAQGTEEIQSGAGRDRLLLLPADLSRDVFVARAAKALHRPEVVDDRSRGQSGSLRHGPRGHGSLLGDQFDRRVPQPRPDGPVVGRRCR